LLVEKDQYPLNATVRNFGQVVPSGMAGDWFQYGVSSTRIYKSIQSEFDISIRQNGSVYIASDESEQALLHELKVIMDNKSYDCELLTTQQCIERWPALQAGYCKEALFFKEEVSAEPPVLIHKLIKYCLIKFPNLTYKPLTTVVDCYTTKNEVELVTQRNEHFTCDKVIICNGSEFKLLFSDLFKKSGIVVSKLQMLRTVPMPEVALEGNILTGLTIRRYESFEECPSFNAIATPDTLAELKKWGIHILFKKAKDGSIIIGDSHEYAAVNSADDLGYELIEHINKLMLSEASKIVSFDVTKTACAWAGYYAQHPVKDIVEFDLEGRIHIRTAIGGKGMTSSAGYAERSIQKLYA
jgi:FAD dependent oxidoreductase TIGR03364